MYVLVRFRVEDFERWKAALDERAPVRAEHGCRGGTVFTRHDSDRRPVLLAEWDAAANAEAYFEGSDFEDAMRDAGVKTKPDVTLLEHVGNLAVDDGDDADRVESGRGDADRDGSGRDESGRDGVDGDGADEDSTPDS